MKRYNSRSTTETFLVWFPFNLTSFFGQKFKKNLNSLEFKIFTQSFHPKLKLWSKSLGKTALWAAARTTRKQNSSWNILIGLGIMQRKVRIFEWEWRVIGYIHYAQPQYWQIGLTCTHVQKTTTFITIIGVFILARCLKITEKVSFNIASKGAMFTFWVDKS